MHNKRRAGAKNTTLKVAQKKEEAQILKDVKAQKKEEKARIKEEKARIKALKKTKKAQPKVETSADIAKVEKFSAGAI
jgi:hypothetical protein